ncbi:unnamed protein product [Discosporangium mesarthrocarpum]
MDILQKNYDSTYRNHASEFDETRVAGGDQYRTPRIIHHIWLGSPLPAKYMRLRQTWGDMHVGWQLRLWTDDDVEGLHLKNQQAFDAAPNFGEKSDIMRYEILHQHGGLYVDVDFLCLGAFDSLHKCFHFFAGLSNTGTFELNNGLIGCSVGHPFLGHIIRRIGQGQSSEVPLPGVCPSSSTTAGDGAGSLPLLGAIKAAGAGKRSNPLAGLLGGNTGALGGLLGEMDHANLAKAFSVEEESAAATIMRTGPGLFTEVVMEQISKTSRTQSSISGSRAGQGNAATNSAINPSCVGKQVYSLEGRISEEVEDLERVMILPPSFFYPVPNDAPPGLLGDGSKHGLLARLKMHLHQESLAVHLWAKSWQHPTMRRHKGKG